MRSMVSTRLTSIGSIAWTRPEQSVVASDVAKQSVHGIDMKAGFWRLCVRRVIDKSEFAGEG